MKYSILFIFLLVSLTLRSQTDEERSAMAREILDQMAEKNQNYSTIETTFELTIDNHQSNTKSHIDGSLTVKGDKYVLDIPGSTTYFDGETIYSYVKDANEVNISQPSEEDDSAITPNKMFGSYSEGYKLRWMDEVKVDDVTCNQIELYPIERGGNIARIRIEIDKETHNIKRLMQQGKDGICYYVDILKFVINKEISDTKFKFYEANYPDVEIIDLR